MGRTLGEREVGSLIELLEGLYAHLRATEAPIGASVLFTVRDRASLSGATA